MLMGVERMMVITGELIKHGADPKTPVALVRWATRGNQQTLIGTLGDIADMVKSTGFQAPAVCVIGDVVKEREEDQLCSKTGPSLANASSSPAPVTRRADLTKELSKLGADVIELPTIKIVEPKNRMEFGELVQDSHTYDWLVFSSPNGVDAFFKLFFKLYNDARCIGGVKIACIGPAPPSASKPTTSPWISCPRNSWPRPLVEKFKKDEQMEHLKVLWVRAEEAREVIAAGLNKLGAIVDEALAYRTVPEREDNQGAIQRMNEEGADIITFTSSSTVECFFALGLELPKE